MEHTYENKTVKNDFCHSLTTLLEGAKKGSPYCMVKLANRNQKHRICFDGKSIIDEEEEFQWLYSAAELGYAPSFIPLGLRYQCGTGTEKSKEKAAFWFYKAEEAGIETSRDYLMHLWQEAWSEKLVEMRLHPNVNIGEDAFLNTLLKHLFDNPLKDSGEE